MEFSAEDLRRLESWYDRLDSDHGVSQEDIDLHDRITTEVVRLMDL